MRYTFLVFVTLFSVCITLAQVGINTASPNALLEIQSSNQVAPANTDGVLIPKIDAFPIINPTVDQQSMLVYLTTISGINQPGFYYWDNLTTTWLSISKDTKAWSVTGNAGTNATTNFIGTTDNIDVVFKRNDMSAGLLNFDKSNTSFGINSLQNDTTGNSSTAIGSYALRDNTTGNFNTAVGTRAMIFNVTGSGNIAIGGTALTNNISGSRNTAVGFASLSKNTIGFANTATGFNSLLNNTTGNYNSATGDFSLFFNTIGNNNTANGNNSLFSNTTGSFNTANGNNSLSSNTTGSRNTANGNYSLLSNTTGSFNTAYGSGALTYNTTGNYNTATGNQSLHDNTTGVDNTAIGVDSLFYNSTGNYNTAVGNSSISDNISGDRNSSLGYKALVGISTGFYNTALGAFSYPTGDFSNSAAIGDACFISASNQVRVGDFTISSIGGFTNWTNVSDKRFKKDIQYNVPGLDFIKKLKPVTYHLDMDVIADYFKTPNSNRKKESESLKGKMLQTGFIAQDVEIVAKQLGFDFSGIDVPKNDTDFYGLRYAEFVVPLTKAVQELEAENQNLKTQIKKLQEQIVLLFEKIN